MTSQTTLRDIVKKIRALRARAADSASSENEAAMAAKVADELLERHNINLSEVDVRADGVVKERWDSGHKTCPVESWALRGIDKGCNVRSWYQRGVITVVGSPADVETALYYIDLTRVAVIACWDNFQKTEEFWRQRESGQSAREIGFSFRKGVAMRIGARIGKFAESPDRSRSSSNALVPVKNALVAAYLDENNIKIYTARASSVDTTALYAGMRAGENVALGRGIATSRPVAMIVAQ